MKSKITVVTGIMAVIGFFIFMGVAGSLDCNDSYSLISATKSIILGLLLMLPAGIVGWLL